MDNVHREFEAYAKLVFDKLKDLHSDNSELSKKVDAIQISLTKLESSKEDTESLKKYVAAVNEVWSPTQMKEAKDEIYEQKGKWSIVYGVILAINVAWIVVMALLRGK